MEEYKIEATVPAFCPKCKEEIRVFAGTALTRPKCEKCGTLLEITEGDIGAAKAMVAFSKDRDDVRLF